MEFTFEKAKLPNTNFIPEAVYLANYPLKYGNWPYDAVFKGIVDEFGENDQSGIESGGGIRLRYLKTQSKTKHLAFIVIINTKNKTEYPNRYDKNKGILTYYGDNKEINRGYLDTKKKGNKILKEQFEIIYDKKDNISSLCPILYFESVFFEGKSGKYKGSKFVGLAYPFIEDEPLENVFTVKTNNNIENARFKFTIVPDAFSKVWLHDLTIGDKFKEQNAPTSWLDYITKKRDSKLITNKYSSSTLDKNEKNKTFADIRTSEVESKSMARHGQNEIRNQLLSRRKSCELCNISTKAILVASHILGWKENIDERGNLNNVMLLCSNHDKLLDRKLITFDYKTGKIIISDKVKKTDYDQLLMNENISIEMNVERQNFFKEHNELFSNLN